MSEPVFETGRLHRGLPLMKPEHSEANKDGYVDEAILLMDEYTKGMPTGTKKFVRDLHFGNLE
jgi:hypothetical protein